MWIMFLGSLVVGFFITTSLLVDKCSHVKSSLTKFYMAVHMALWMVVIDLFIMWYRGHRVNVFLALGTFVLIIIVIVAARAQMGVGDSDYLKAMIQHHSSAILTSNRILTKTTNTTVYDLACRIIKSQEEEIDEMEHALENIL